MSRMIARSMALAALAAGAAWGQLTVSCAPPLPEVVGTVVTATCSATGGIAPYTFAITLGALPPNLSMDTAGNITGTLADPAGPYIFTVTATDSTPILPLIGFQIYSGTTVDPLTVSCTSSAGPVEVNVPYSNSCTAAGGTPPYSWGTSGTAPPGLAGAITPAGNSATISYTPASALASYQYRVKVTDNSPSPITGFSQQFNGAIAPAVTITTTSPLPDGAVGSAYSQQFAAGGGVAPFGWAATGLTGSGLTMSSSGLLSGTPTTAGPLSGFNVTVTDAAGGTTGAVRFTLNIEPALTISTTSPLQAATIGSSYSQTFAASGGSNTGFTWSVSGQPSWLAMSAAGVLNNTGASVPATALTATVTVKVTDSAGNTASGSFIVPVTLEITTASPLATAAIGTLYSQALKAEGGTGGYTWAVTTGSPPAGLSLSTAGVLNGTPLTTAQDATFTITVTDSGSETANSQFIIPVNLLITTTSPLANGTVGATYSQTLSGEGGLPASYAWTVSSGSLPGGLKLGTNGAITGTPSGPGTFPFTVQLADSATPPDTPVSKPFVITIGAGLTITTGATLPNATVGIAYSQTLAAAGGIPPYTWSITTGALPANLSLSSGGAITGTPNASGTASFTVKVSDTTGNSFSQPFTLTAVTPPVINTSTLPNGNAGVSYSQSLSASGGTPPYTWTVASGSLPSGLSLSTGGAITGTPAAAGTASFTVQVKDATGVTATKALALTIISSLTITTVSPLTSGEVSVAYSVTLAATGGTAPYTWSVASGGLPSGLTLATGGAITGVPASAGVFNITVLATDSNHLTASAPLTLTIVAALSISTPSGLNGGSVGSGYAQTLTAASGVAPYIWALVTAPLPPGLNLSPAGTIGGTPATAGTFPFTVKVTDALGATASRQFSIIVVAGLTISSPSTLPNGVLNAGYSNLLLASGGTSPYTWVIIAGSPPAGLGLRSNGNLTGTPTAGGTFTFTVQVTDSVGHHATEQMTINVTTLLTITSTSLPGGAVGTSYAESLAASGGTPPYSWSITKGALPGGLSLSAAGSITGTLAAAGTFSFTVQVTDSVSTTVSRALSIVVTVGLAITTAAALPNAQINTSYSQTLAVAGGKSPYTWALTGGALPAGVTLSAAGAVTGTPTAAGTFTFTATVTDSASATASRQFTLLVQGGLSITTTSLPDGKIGTSYSQTLAASGGTPPYTWARTAGSLPPGLALSGAIISGTPTTPGTYSFTIQVSDSASATATQPVTVTITGFAVITSALPAAALGTPYSVTLAAAGGSPPYSWTSGKLPGGLSLDASTGTLSGTPSASGSFNVTLQVTDSAKATASSTLTLNVVAASYTGLSATATSAQQLNGTLALGAAFPQAISGQITLAFQPDSSIGSPADDPAIQFSSGGPTASFTIPANSTVAVPFSLQTGTVAGTITLSVTWQAGGASLPSPAALTQTIQIAPAVPVISAVSASTTSSGFQILVTAYSNTREVSQAVVQFTAASGQTLQTTSATVSLTTAATSWFQSSTSDQFGGQFILTLPFSVSNGSAGAIASVSVQLVNSQGTSTSSNGTL